MPIYPSNQYDNLMAKSQLTINNVTDFNERTIYDVVDAQTGETTLNYPSLTLYDFADDFILGEGYAVATQIMTFAVALLGGTTEAQINYFMKEKEIKIRYVTELARKMAFEIRRLNREGYVTALTTVQNRSQCPEPQLPSSKTIRSYLNQ